MRYIIRFVVLILLAVFGLMIFFNSSVFANGQKSKEYYSAIVETQIQARLHGENVDTNEVLINEVINTLFSFIRFKVDEVHKEHLLREND